jgi:DNA topoisomerase-1
MSKDQVLVIVESPAKCKKIESFLGPGYKCIASFGHIQELPGLSCIDTENNFAPSYKVIETKSSHISNIRYNITRSSKIFLATDDDREGEGIAWHICQVFQLPLTTPRIIFHEITKDAIVNAVNNPGVIDMNKVRAQQARQILDVLVGYKVSPVLWSNIARNSKQGLSAGRCQTPALRIVYDNQQDIKKSPGRKVYNTTGYFTTLNLGFTLNHNHEIVDDVEHEEDDSSNVMETFLEDSASYNHMYTKGESKESKKNPPSPLTTADIQQRASNEMNLSPKDTMSICQKLYEAGLITYMRTDSTTYSKEFIELIETHIVTMYNDTKYVHPDIKLMSLRSNEEKGSGTKKKKGKKSSEDEGSAQEAHEAIRPTNIKINDVDDKEELSSREKRMYKLIWTNTMESCMAVAVYASLSAKVSAPDNYHYKYSAEQVVFPGWKIVKGYEKESQEYAYLNTLKSDTEVEYNKIYSKVSMKDLKSHYTEAKLVQLLKNKGIGRPSTFSSIIDKIQERGYVKKEDVKGQQIKCVDYTLEKDELTEIENMREFGNEKNKLVVQQLGIITLEFLVENFESIFDYDYTKNMENDLDEISKGVKEWTSLCGDCNKDIDTLIDAVVARGGSSGGTKSGNIRIDGEHEYIVGKYGPVIKKTEPGTSKISFVPVKKDIDISKLRNKEYTLSDIIDTMPNEQIIGSLANKDIVLKNGKFGLYAICDGTSVSITLEDGQTQNDIDISVVERAIKDKREGNSTNNSSIVRVINSESSIRNGKYGQYIYYKTAKMSKPSFIKLQGFSGNYLECPASELEMWIKNSRGDIPASASAAEAKGTTSKRKPSASDRSSKKKWGK